MTGIPAHTMCRMHRAWEALFIASVCALIIDRGTSVIRDLKLEGRFDLRLVKQRMKEIRKLDGGPRGVAFPTIPYTSSDFLGYIHPNRHILYLRRVCAECRSLIDNHGRTVGHLHLPRYIRRVK